MRNISYTITVPQSFSPISALITENNSYILALRFNIHETLQINQSNFLIFNPVFIRVSRNHIVYTCR